MLVLDPELRIKPEAALKHPFFVRNSNNSQPANPDTICQPANLNQTTATITTATTTTTTTAASSDLSTDLSQMTHTTTGEIRHYHLSRLY